MDNQNFDFLGAHSKKKEDLIMAFNQIEEKYQTFFKERPSKFDVDNHDRLKRHYMIYESYNKITFAFDPDSDLPESIKSECTEVYIRLFGHRE
jgi:hypothetical protein